MRAFASRCELLTYGGDHLRFVHAEFARAMVAAGSAEAHNSNGRVKSVRLVAAASSFAQRIGEPTGKWGGVRFHRWVNLDCGARIVEHHPRATYG